MLRRALSQNREAAVADPGVGWAAPLICLLASLPVALVTYVPANDYPFHSARIAILSQLADPVYDRFYDLGSLLLPNLGMDLVSLALAPALGYDLASRLFVMLCLIAMMAGTVLLHRAAHDRWSVWPLLASGLLFNGIFLFGFYSYLFGAGLALCAAALWLRIDAGPFRLLLTFVCAILLMLCHMEAFGIYALLLSGFELHRAGLTLRAGLGWRSLRDLALAALPFLAALALLFLLSPTAEEAGNPIRYDGYWAAPLHGLLFSLSSTHVWLDALSWVALGLLAAGSAMLLGLRVNWPVMLGAAMLALAIAILPGELLGSLYADIRLGPVLAMSIIAGLDFARPSRRVAAGFLAAVLLVTAARTVFFVQTWRGFDAQIGRIVESFDAMGEGAMLLVASMDRFPSRYLATPGVLAVWHPSLKHIGSYAAMRPCRCFVPMTFADLTKQPLAVAPDFAAIKAFQGDRPLPLSGPAALRTLLGEIDRRRRDDWPELAETYLLVMGGPESIRETLRAHGVIAASGPRHSLLRLPDVTADKP